MSLIPWVIGAVGLGYVAVAGKKRKKETIGTGGVFQVIIDFPNGLTQGQADIARAQWESELVGGEVINVQRIGGAGATDPATLQIDARYDSYPNIAPVQSTVSYGGATGRLMSVQRIG